ncbi:MAG: ABC transporter permease [Ruminococcaceae bacterium]|nr:ABC transporter permease [Oscillospiraceae bacterium]
MKILSRSYIALIIAILYIPILVLMLFSFNSTNNTGVFTGFSTYWYEELFRSAETFTALKNTLILAVSSAVISTLIGTAASLGLHRMRSKFLRGAIVSVTNIPMMNPDIVTGISMMLLFVFVGTRLGSADKLNFWTLLIAHVTFNLPYVILNVTPKFRQMDKHLPEAALDLGCTPVQSFFKVELPNVMPGIVTGFIMAFTLSLDDFVISYFCAGSDFQTLPILIYSMTKKEVKPDIYALSTLMIIAVLTLLILTNLTGDRDGKNSKNPDWRSHMRQRVQERRAHRTAGKGGDAK